jgi:uncharacterized protein YndB with AHSA1/START domain
MTSRKHHGRTIDHSVRMKTTPMRAWQAWADPQHIANWFVDRAEGEAAPGNVMKWFFDTFGYSMDVPVVEADPGKTFVSGGGDQPGPDGIPYLMEITISKDGGETVMQLVNSGFSTDPKKDENFRGVESGWKNAMATMKVWLEQFPLRNRHHDLVVRPAQFTPEQLRPLYATAEGRSKWMQPDLDPGGDVLCDTGTELLLALNGSDGVISLKQFAMGPQRMVGLDLSTWPDAGAAPVDAKPRLNRALDRLLELLQR